MPTIPEILLGCDAAERAALVRSLPGPAALALHLTFAEWAHPGQLAPEGDWRSWVLMAGRGFGKTRAGAEWMLAGARSASSSPGGGGGTPFDAACGVAAAAGHRGGAGGNPAQVGGDGAGAGRLGRRRRYDR